MLELIERLIMLELSKNLAKSQAEEQKVLLDTLLDGAQKAAQVVSNIKCISSGGEPKVTAPLYKNEPIKEQQVMDLRPPMEPTFMAPKIPVFDDTKALRSVYDRLGFIQGKLDNIYVTGICGKADLEPLIKDCFELRKNIFDVLTKK
jgi:hypothetical protein